MNEQISLLNTSVPQPLPARLRPETLDEIIGQTHLLGPGKVLTGLVKKTLDGVRAVNVENVETLAKAFE